MEEIARFVTGVSTAGLGKMHGQTCLCLCMIKLVNRRETILNLGLKGQGYFDAIKGDVQLCGVSVNIPFALKDKIKCSILIY